MSVKSTGKRSKRSNKWQSNPQQFKRIKLEEDSFSNKRKNGNSTQLSISDDDTFSVPIKKEGFQEKEKLKAWFDDTLKLPQYFNLFYKEGFEDLDSLEGLDESDVIELGIRKKGHIKKMLRGIAKLHQPTSINTKQANASNNKRFQPMEVIKPKKNEKGKKKLKAWFADTLEMPQYFNLFYDAGCEDLDSLEGLVEDDLIDLGIKKTFHMKKIAREIAKLHQRTSINTKQAHDSNNNSVQPKKKKRANKPNLKGIVAVRKLKKLTIGKRHRTIMVIGATGTGKTTLLNSMVNYLWEVEYDDEFRYKLVYETLKKHGQAESVTDNVTAYLLDAPTLDYELTVIDTPGFGDTRGHEQDQKITKQIKEFFEKKIQDIDAICFVINATQPRLTATQIYIFAQVLGIFGNDIADNILILMTFADGKKPPALAALKAGKVPFKESFKLNNSAFDLPENEDDCDDFSKLFWDMGMKAFDKLFKSIGQLKTKSLALTKKVLTRREQLESHVESVQPTIRKGFTVLNQLRNQIEVVRTLGHKMDQNKDFEYTEQVDKARQIPNGGAFNTTTCMTCNYTCHKDCSRADDKDKEKCCAMDRSDGSCRNCPGFCHWTLHRNVPYTIEWYQETVTKTYGQLKDKYVDANSKKSAAEQIMAGSVDELAVVEQDLNGLINNVRKCLNELGKIALRPNVLSQEDYLNKLIQSEEAEKKPGYQRRVKALHKLKAKQELLSKLNNDKYEPWKQYHDVHQYINKNNTIKKKRGLFSFF